MVAPLRGRGRVGSVEGATGASSEEGRFSCHETAFLGRDLGLSLVLSARETDNENSASFDSRVGRFTTGLDFPIGELSRLSLRYTYQDSKLSGGAASISKILKDEIDQGAVVTSSLGYTYSYDTRISGLNPKGGVLLRFSQDFAGLGGDSKYVLTSGLALAGTKVRQEEVTLRGVFEGGVLTSLAGTNSRSTERFYGNGKIRGFESNGLGPRDQITGDALGGNIFAVARFEAEFPVGLPEEYGISGGLFLDVGSVWSLDNINGGAGGGSRLWHEAGRLADPSCHRAAAHERHDIGFRR